MREDCRPTVDIMSPEGDVNEVWDLFDDDIALDEANYSEVFATDSTEEAST